jgi:hypothetical protein
MIGRGVKLFLMISLLGVGHGSLAFAQDADLGGNVAYVRLRTGEYKKLRLMNMPVPARPHVNLDWGLEDEANSTPLTGTSDVPVAPPAPTSFYIQAKSLAKVLDQGDRNVCSYFTTVSLLETYYINHNPDYQKKPVSLSEECLLGLRQWMFESGEYTGPLKPLQNPEDVGDAASYIAKTIVTFGVPEAKRFSKVSCNYRIYEDHIKVPLTDYQRVFDTQESQAFGKGLNLQILRKQSAEDLKQILASGRPAIVGFYMFDEFFHKEQWLYNSEADKESTIKGAHSVMLVGYRTVGQKTYFMFKNSWGIEWGRSGYGELDYDLLNFSWNLHEGLDFVVTY